MAPKERSRSLAWILVIGLVSSGISRSVLAETGFDIYPESRFGAGPVEPGFRGAKSWVKDAAQTDEGSGNDSPKATGRGIASVESTATAPAEAPPALPDQKRPPSVQGIQEISVIAGDGGFFPKMLFVSKDIPVRLYVTSASRGTLCIIMDSFQVRRQLRTQRIEEITFTPDIPGKYRFYCPVNGSEGYVVVRELNK